MAWFLYKVHNNQETLSVYSQLNACIYVKRQKCKYAAYIGTYIHNRCSNDVIYVYIIIIDTNSGMHRSTSWQRQRATHFNSTNPEEVSI